MRYGEEKGFVWTEVGGGKGGRLSVAPGWSGGISGLTGQNRVSGVRTLRKIISGRLEETARSFFLASKDFTSFI